MLRSRALWFIYTSAVLSAIGPITFAQQVPAGPTFEVASVKPTIAGGGSIMDDTGGRFTGSNVTARMLILNAYSLRNVQIEGGPTWLGADFSTSSRRFPTASPSAKRDRGQRRHRCNSCCKPFLRSDST